MKINYTLQVTWRKDLREIDFFASDHKYMVKETGSLFIDRADVSDTARFLCVVENPAGVVTREITLTVHGKIFIIWYNVIFL